MLQFLLFFSEVMTLLLQFVSKVSAESVHIMKIRVIIFINYLHLHTVPASLLVLVSHIIRGCLIILPTTLENTNSVLLTVFIVFLCRLIVNDFNGALRVELCVD